MHMIFITRNVISETENNRQNRLIDNLLAANGKPEITKRRFS